jgi:hypothetical protein
MGRDLNPLPNTKQECQHARHVNTVYSSSVIKVNFECPLVARCSYEVS